jgi:hypothetical protein
MSFFLLASQVLRIIRERPHLSNAPGARISEASPPSGSHTRSGGTPSRSCWGGTPSRRSADQRGVPAERLTHPVGRDALPQERGSARRPRRAAHALGRAGRPPAGARISEASPPSGSRTRSGRTPSRRSADQRGVPAERLTHSVGQDALPQERGSARRPRRAAHALGRAGRPPAGARISEASPPSGSRTRSGGTPSRSC